MIKIETGPPNQTTPEPINVSGVSKHILPTLSIFTQEYAKLLAAQRKDGIQAVQRASNQRYNASLSLFGNILDAFSIDYSSLLIQDTVRTAYSTTNPATFTYEIARIAPQKETNLPMATMASQIECQTPVKEDFFDLTMVGLKILQRAYEPTLKNDILISTLPLLEGHGTLDHLKTPGQLNAVIKAAAAKISGDKDSYTQAIDAYANEIDSIAEQFEPGTVWGSYLNILQTYRISRRNQKLFTRYGNNDRRNSIDRELTYTIEGVSEDTYHPHIRNTLLVAPTVLDRAIGGIVENSILATGEKDPLSRAVDLHLINTYVVDVNGKVHYYNDIHVGRCTENGASQVDWRRYPDFKKAYQLAA
jgi:hypothetical protein